MQVRHIFISYKSQERVLAYHIRDRLQSWGYATWLDVDNLSPKEDWEDEFEWQHQIDAALKSAAAVVAIVTPIAIQSRYVTTEWDIALVRGIPFVPLLFEVTEIPSKYKWLKFLPGHFDTTILEFPQLKVKLAEALAKSPHSLDPYYTYLATLYDQISLQLGRLMIKTLSTYGSKGHESGDPIRLMAEIAVDSLSGKLHIDEKSSSNEFVTYNDFDQAVEVCGREVIVLGEPGAGKTVMLLNYARDAIIKRLQDQGYPLPVLATISMWNYKTDQSFSAWLVNTSGVPKEAAKLIEQGHTILLLDGLDELPLEREDPSMEQVFYPRRQFLNDLPTNNRLVMTCRPQEYESIREHISTHKVVQLLSLHIEQIEAYLRDQPEVLQAIHNDINLREMIKTPLLLSLFAFSYEAMTPQERQQFHHFTGSGDLRDRIFHFYLEKRYAHERSRDNALLPMSKIVEYLGQLAVHKCQGDGTISLSDLGYVLGYEQEVLAAFTHLMVKLHILILQGSADEPFSSQDWDKDRFRFIHNLLRDYFAFHYALQHLHDLTSYKRYHNPAFALGVLQDSRSVEPLLDALKDPETTIRLAVAKCLVNFKDPRIVQSLIDTLKDESPNIRYHAALSLGQLNDRQAIEPLRLLLTDTEEVFEGMFGASQGSVAQTAAIILKRFGIVEVSPVIEAWRINENRQLLEDLLSSDVEIRSNAIVQLSEWGDETTCEPLIQLLSDITEDAWGVPVAYRAIYALGMLQLEKAVPALIQMLSFAGSNQAFDLSHGAAQALKKIGTPEALEAISRWKTNG